MTAANEVFDAIAEGPEGEIVLSAADIEAIDSTLHDPAAITAKLDHAIKTRPGFQVSITEAAGGGLRIVWRTRL